MGLFGSLFGKSKNEGYEEYTEDGYYAPTEAAPTAAPATGVGVGSASSLELKVVRPENFGAVTAIATHLLSHRTVVLNLEATSKEDARRLLDFLAGVAFSISGNLKRVANNTYVITPDNVDVSGETAATRETPRPAAPSANDF